MANLTAIWHTSPTKTLADAMTRETTIAATSAGASSESFPLLMNRLAGTKFKVIKGYSGTAGTVLAMERGETEGGHATVEQLLYGKKDWLRDKKAAVLVQYTLARHPAFPDAPAMVEFGRTPLDKQVLALFAGTADVGRSVMAPPGVPRRPARGAAPGVRRHAQGPGVPAGHRTARPANSARCRAPKLQQRVAAMLSVSPEVIKHAIASSR